ncbi:MAG: hypothetical protein V1661_01845 [bacterium]
MNKKNTIIIGAVIAALAATAVIFIVSRKKTPSAPLTSQNIPVQSSPAPQILKATAGPEPFKTLSAKDTDRDDLPNEEEALRGTAYNNSDTDGDGLSDGDEVKKWGTDPLDSDTDGDGVSDGAEVKAGTNPLGDGILKI